MKKQKNILLTWDAFNNGFAVTAQMLALLLSKDVIINEIIYFQNDSLKKINKAEIDLFFNNKNLGECLKIATTEKEKERLRMCEEISTNLSVKPQFNNQFLNIKNVTDYQSIYNSLSFFIKENLYGLENTQLHINVSPGTPQMHVVWLMLNSSGFLPSYSKLWSTQWIREKQVTSLEQINFKPKSYVSDVLQARNAKQGTILINPNDTKSLTRRTFEDKLLLFNQIPKAPILLLGERGVGKSTYVRNVIKQDDEPFFELACGTFSDELMRAELFGYEKGAFTGANANKDGILSYFKEGGVLFLDEIQDLSRSLQRVLIQVLQSGKYFPIGSVNSVSTNFRLVTASNKSLNDLYTKSLSEDFFDRISRFIVEVPPLRDCNDDIESYWKGVWKELCDFESAPAVIWSPKLEKFIKSQELRGNFRDLQKIASHIILYYLETKDESISIDKAIKEFLDYEGKISSTLGGAYFIEDTQHSSIIANFEKDLAEWAIRVYGGKELASQKLNISISKLNKDLKMDRIKRLKK